MNVVTRFAPSPTGLLHAGNYRTAIFAYLFARHHGGTNILRIEDTDRERSKKEYEDNILESLAWLGIEHDQFMRQSEHSSRHADVLKSLIENGHAYVSKESPRDEGERSEVIRFKNPKKKITFTDVVRGAITMDTSDLGDFVIAKSMHEPIFHLVNVADDIEQGVTHIVRGEDHVSNTPRQLLIFEALGATPPVYIHLPLVLAPDRTKLSKRKGALPLLEYRDRGYVPQALFNYLSLLGWNPGTDEELLSKSELIERFTEDQIQKSPAIFDDQKLKWFNREYMLRLDTPSFWEHAEEFLSEETVTMLDAKGIWESVVPVMRERSHTFMDVRAMDENGDIRCFYETPTYDPALLLWKKDLVRERTAARLAKATDLLRNIDSSSWNRESIESTLMPLAEAEGKGEVLWPVRVALSGRDKSPDPFTIAGIIHKDETIHRLEHAQSLLS